VNPAAREVDGRELVAEVPEAVVQQAPRGGRLAASGLGDEENRQPRALEGRRVEEEEVAPQPLELDGEVLLELEDELPDVLGEGQIDVPPADQDASAPRRLDRVGQRVRGCRALAGRAERAEHLLDRPGVCGGRAGDRDVLPERRESKEWHRHLDADAAAGGRRRVGDADGAAPAAGPRPQLLTNLRLARERWPEPPCGRPQGFPDPVLANAGDAARLTTNGAA
jgi:hypothetical protein